MSQAAVVFRAFTYLQATSIRNAVVQRVKRLKQPKYLFGAIAGGAYLYYFMFRQLLGMRSGGSASVQGWIQQPAMQSAILGAAALLLLVIVALAWLVPSRRAALTFSEAEVAFLFPAPMTRKMLIHYKLLRSQLGVLFSAFIFSLITRRASMLGGHAVLPAAGWWLILSTLRLHFIGASFWRDYLLDLGVHLWLRRLLVVGIVLGLLVGSGVWLWAHAELPAASDLDSAPAIAHYVSGLLATPPLAWALVPFKWMLTPLFAVDGPSFLRALPPAILLLLLNYIWVVRSDTAFEEASIDASRRKAAKIADRRLGKSAFSRQSSKPRGAPFALAPQGAVPVAFLWKNLIALGPFYRLRTWLMACVVVVAGGTWMSARPEFRPALQGVGGMALAIAGWLLVVGPMFMQRSLSRMFLHLDVLKSGPLAGRQIVLGELLTPMVLMTLGQWLALLLAAMAFVDPSRTGMFSAANLLAGLVGLALLAPALCGLMMCVPFAGMLLFPAWLAGGSRERGIEVMGQRMIFLAGYVLVLVVAMLPAALVGGVAFLAGRWLGSMAVGLVSAAVLGAAVLVVELRLAVAWLGRRVEHIDLSREQLG